MPGQIIDSDIFVIDNVVKIIMMPRTLKAVSIDRDQNNKQKKTGGRNIPPVAEGTFDIQFEILFNIHDTA
jgi:hypothetical protein